jgi:ferrous iron transport protein A
METTSTIPLSQVEDGRVVSIIGIEGGRGLRSRLTTMGLLPKTQILVVHNGRSGPFVISVKNCRMVIGRGVADKIMVT